MAPSPLPRVLVVGGGFGGLRVAQQLARAPVEVTLVDRSNHHLFQPLLYQVATSALTGEEIASPIRSVLRRQRNARVLLGEVDRIDLVAQRATLADGASLDYDYVVVAAGAQTAYYGHTEWMPHTVGLKDLHDALALRTRVLGAFEAAERATDDAARRRLLTFVVIGGGPTGVEMAGALSELARALLRRDFRRLNTGMLRVILVEMGKRVLAPFHPSLSADAAAELKRIGVEVRNECAVRHIDADGVVLNDEQVPAALVCWAAGVQPRPLAANLGVATNRRGGIDVQPDCSVAGHANAFVIGDMASFTPAGAERPLPGVAPVAMQMGLSVAANIRGDLAGRPRRPFAYFDKGIMATIGTGSAVLQQGRIRMHGFVAWLAWIVVHVYYIIGFRNRSLVLFEWFWSFLTRRRSARLIIDQAPQLPRTPAPAAGLASTAAGTAAAVASPLG